MKELLLEMKAKVEATEAGVLEKDANDGFRVRYQEILDIAEKTECPEPKKESKRGPMKKLSHEICLSDCESLKMKHCVLRRPLVLYQ